MASINQNGPVRNVPPHHQRSRSNVLTSFIHRRNNSDGSSLKPAELRPLSIGVPQPPGQHDMAVPNFSRPAALEEIQNVEAVPRSPSKPEDRSDIPRSPTKHGFIPLPFKSAAAKDRESGKPTKTRDESQSPKKPKKTKSATNLVALLSRPKGQKNILKPGSEEEMYTKKDKENQTPPMSLTPQEVSRPPIYAQFSSGALERQQELVERNGALNNSSSNDLTGAYPVKERPKSYHAQYATTPDLQKVARTGSDPIDEKSSPSKVQRGLKIFTNGGGLKNKSSTAESSDFVLDPKDIDKHLEAMLDRRNIPENQRYKMRNLANTIKMEFIRQDWAESRGLNGARPGSHSSNSSMIGSQDQDNGAKRSRGRSFTLSRSNGKKNESRSPTKKSKGEGTLGRHFRSRSTDSLASERPSSAGSSSGNGILSKMKLHQGPVDYVQYLRKVRQPELVEVGKLHKLRLLLRNETVAWTEEFIRQGGMQEIVGLLHRIMEVEWRCVSPTL